MEKRAFRSPSTMVGQLTYSIQHYSFICTQLNGSKYYVPLTIQLNLCYFFFFFFLHTNYQTVLLPTIQFSINQLFALRTLSDATTPGQSGPGSDGNERVLHIPQSSSIAEASLSDCLLSYTEHSLVVMGVGLTNYISTKMQSVYFTAPANRVR